MYAFREQIVRNALAAGKLREVEDQLDRDDNLERNRAKSIATALDWTDKALSAGRRAVLHEDEQLELCRRDGQFGPQAGA